MNILHLHLKGIPIRMLLVIFLVIITTPLPSLEQYNSYDVTVVDTTEDDSDESVETSTRPNPKSYWLPYTKSDKTVKIGSFNLRQFGMKKSKNEDIVDIVARIISRYDLIALQEITDIKNMAITRLMDALLHEAPATYQYILSDRVGYTKQTEQYAFFYRPDIFELGQHQLYDDDEFTILNRQPLFARRPYLAEFTIKQNKQKVGFINVHTSPKNTTIEIGYLERVVEWIEDMFDITDVVMLGDMSASCYYLPLYRKPTVKILNNPDYKVLIPDFVDTTVDDSVCAYDRIIVTGPFVSKNFVPSSGRAFEFDTIYELDQKTALRISDHYPVEFKLNVGAIWRETTTSKPPATTTTKPTLNRGSRASPDIILCSVLLLIYTIL